MIRRTGNLFLFLVLLLSISCKHKLEKATWQVEALAPLMKSSLSIANLVEDSMIKVNSDNSISLVYQQNIYNYPLDSLVFPFDTVVSTTHKMDSLSLGRKKMVYPMSLGEIAKNAGLVGQLIINNNGGTMVVPPMSGLSSGDFEVDATEFFETATFQQGYMDITFKNELPLDVANLVFQFRNKISGTVIIQDTFLLIPANTSQKRTKDLAGKTVEGMQIAKIISMDLPGSYGLPIPVDTSNALIATMVVRDIKVFEATAIFPPQILMSQLSEEALDLGQQLLTSAIVSSGYVKTEIYSTMEDTMYFTFSMPRAVKNGNIFLKIIKVPPAPPGGTIHVDLYHDFTGYKLDLTGEKGNKFNTISRLIEIRFDSTGNLVHLSLEDSLQAVMGIVQVKPAYVKGYLGQELFNVGPSFEKIDFFDRVKSGSIELDDLKVSLEIDNGLGIKMQMLIKAIEAMNTKTGKAESLSGSLLSTWVSIQRAVDNPHVPAITTIKLDKSNSNITSLMQIFPDKLNYEFDLTFNPQGNDKSYQDFAYTNSDLRANFNMEVPLSLISDQFTLTDTLKLDLSKIESRDKIKDGVFTLFVDNGFPLESYVKLYILNDMQYIVDSLFTAQKIEAASINQFGKVTEKKRSKLVYSVDENKLSEIFEAKEIIAVVNFTSIPKNQFIKIYSEYTIDLKLVGDFNYQVEIAH